MTGTEFTCETSVSSMGECLRFISVSDHTGAVCKTRDADINQDLRLTSGIGPFREESLKGKGYTTLDLLSGHSTWGNRAEKIVEAISNSDIAYLKLCGASGAEILSFFRQEDIIFFDIETTGLKTWAPLFLIGMLEIEACGMLRLTQLLARDLIEESAVIEQAVKLLSSKGVMLSFNGAAFDLPFINARAAYLGIPAQINGCHIDLLPYARRSFKGQVADCRLETLEKDILGFSRVDDIPGWQIPVTYEKYVETGDLSLILPILKHNRQDLLSMIKLMSHINMNKHV